MPSSTAIMGLIMALFPVLVIKQSAIQCSNDVSTSETLSVGAGLKNLTLFDLQAIKNPYGRQALLYMQTLGTLWGIT